MKKTNLTNLIILFHYKINKIKKKIIKNEKIHKKYEEIKIMK